ncbi:MAG: c-type cytochrome, partial [Arcobacter sp.]|nr:c-type cytochrome [Arcobacter sp.]
GIGEYSNPIPSGWGLIFIGAIIWMLWYFFVGYPTNQFSQIGQWNEETLEYQAKFEEKNKNIDVAGLRAMGGSVYLVQCAPCHGVEADGSNGKAHNFTKRISKEQVVNMINNGGNNFKTSFPAGMPAGLVSGADVDTLAAYVSGGFKGEKPAAWANCTSCHGENGEGVTMVAPNLKAYDNDLVTSVLHDGKKGVIGAMPSFAGRLSETQVKAVAEYIRSIGGK